MNARARRPFHNSVIVPLRFLANPFFVHPQYFIAYTQVSENRITENQVERNFENVSFRFFDFGILNMRNTLV